MDLCISQCHSSMPAALVVVPEPGFPDGFCIFIFRTFSSTKSVLKTLAPQHLFALFLQPPPPSLDLSAYHPVNQYHALSGASSNGVASVPSWTLGV